MFYGATAMLAATISEMAEPITKHQIMADGLWRPPLHVHNAVMAAP